MKTNENKVSLLWVALLAMLFALPTSLSAQSYSSYWKKVTSYQLSAQQVGQYTKIIKEFPELILSGNKLRAKAGYTLYVNKGAVLVTGSGSTSKARISHQTLAKKIPGHDWIWQRKPHELLFKYLCDCRAGGGECWVNTEDLSCVKTACTNCLDVIEIGDLKIPEVITI